MISVSVRYFGLAFVVACAASCASAPKVEVLTPVGQQLSGAATVQGVAPDVAEKRLAVGDKLTAVNGIPTATLGDVLTKGIKPTQFTFTKPSGESYETPASSVTNDKGQFQFSLIRPNDALLTTTQFIGTTEPAGIVTTQFGSALASMQRFKGNPGLVEVQVSFAAANNCSKCTLKSFGIVDVPHRSLLTPISVSQAAWIEYPDEGQPAQFTQVPPPTPIGSTTTATATGTFNGTYQGYGNFGTLNGTVSGYGTANTTYNYDYSATNAANMYNLGVAIRNANIRAQNDARTKFVNERYGNLRLGALSQGETVIGHMFFAAPAGFDGPYAFVVSGDDNASIIVFEPSAGNSRH